MILKDEQKNLGSEFLALVVWQFRIDCDKCGAFAEVTMPTREQTQKFIYDMGWRANFRARKYVHLCKSCEGKRRSNKTRTNGS